MAEHTPTPWFKNSKFEIGPRPRTDDQHDGMLHPVADVFGDNREADAAHIVKCVNAFPDLVKALETALGQWGMYADMNEREDERIRLIDERSPEGDLYRHCRKVLNAMKSPGGSDA
jgi:hypothetical protein